MKSIYLDYAAATPVDHRVLDAMQPFWAEQFYNPSSPYLAAKKVRQSVEDARFRVAHWIGARLAEIIFTAGATESINLAINGVMQNYPKAKLLIGATEHESVRAIARKYNHAEIPVGKTGIIDLVALKKLIDDDTVLISLSLSNSEIGTIQPMRDVATLVQETRRLRQLKNNPTPLYLHTDASQTECYLDLHASRLGVDMMTLNGAKMYGPKQTGILFVKTGVQVTPQVVGGGQERGLRSGTENVAGIVGLATALDIAQSERKESIAHSSALRDALQSELQRAFPDMLVNGSDKKRLPNNLSVSWPGVDGERLLMLLDEKGLMVSTGSACAANKNTASHVLQAIGLNDAAIQGSLRMAVGRQTTRSDIACAVELIIDAVRSLQK